MMEISANRHLLDFIGECIVGVSHQFHTRALEDGYQVMSITPNGDHYILENNGYLPVSISRRLQEIAMPPTEPPYHGSGRFSYPPFDPSIYRVKKNDIDMISELKIVGHISFALADYWERR